VAIDPVGLLTEVLMAGDAFGRPPATGDLGEGYLPLPVLPPRTSRKACAPKETRRANGELGVALGGPFSLSSITASSRLAELDPIEEDTLPCRKFLPPNGEVWVGEPESPSVVMDSLRPCCDCALATALVIEPVGTLEVAP
jgi:hypothetical protein